MAAQRKSARSGAGAIAGTSGLATVIVWLLGYFHVALSAEDGSIIAGIVSTVALFVWHYGFTGIWQHIKGGGSTTPAASGSGS